ncbi:MAG: SPFH domain-containing protein [Erysipelotrichaceae bacterium]|nr:SPFH domain-containing protein [Erysipelotrichaceae bacterium]
MSTDRLLNILDVIKYEGDNSTFIWKHPCEDFHTNSKLIVHESQQAIFFANGVAWEPFGPGRYDLETENHVFTQWLKRTFVTNGIDAFHCEVYFINKTVQMAIKWGTESKTRFIEPTYGIPVELGASGEMNLQIIDGAKLLRTLVGTMNGIAWSEGGTNFTKSLQSSFRPLISTAVKTSLPLAIKENNIDLVEIDEHLDMLSNALVAKIRPGFEEYGLTIPQFYVTTVVLPEDNPDFKKLRELHSIELQKHMMQVEADVRTTQAKTKADYMSAEARSKADYMTAEAEAEARIKAAQRVATLEAQTTETEIARRQAERDLIAAQAKAQAAQMAGMAEAAVMQAKGYNQKDVIQADVQKSYADALGNMGPVISGGGGSSIMGDMMGLGVGMAAMNAMSPQIGEMLKGFNVGTNAENTPANTTALETVCPKCGNKLPGNAKFCLECGTKIEVLLDNEMICPKCGKKTQKGKFCMECGSSLNCVCPLCGKELPYNAKFCLECGFKF